jgi:ABC-type Mn2+/Zn2+ transport system permease subunit
MDPKTIEQKSNLSRPFLSAKKLIFIVLALVIVIGLVVFSLTTILDQFSFSSLLGEIHSAFTDTTTKNTAIFMAILLVTYFFFKFFNVSIPYMIRLKALGIKVPLKEAILYYLTSAFLTAISPGILLTEPYNMF